MYILKNLTIIIANLKSVHDCRLGQGKYFVSNVLEFQRQINEWTHIKEIITKLIINNTFTESSGYIMQCSKTPAIAPAVIWVAKLFVGSDS